MLKPFDQIAVTLRVENGAGEHLGCPSSGRCTVRYRWDYTPLWYEVNPKVQVPGMNVTLAVDPQRAMDYRRSGAYPLDWRVDGVSVDLSDDYTYESSLGGGKNYVTGRMMSGKRSAYAQNTIKFNGVGNAHKVTGDGLLCDIHMADCFEARVHPTIASVSESSGYTSGGQLLEVRGTGLDGATSVEVEVDGTPCVVLGNDKDSIRCWTGAHTLVPQEPGQAYVGEHGLHRVMYNDCSPRAHQGNMEDAELLAELEAAGCAEHSIMTEMEIALTSWEQENSLDIMKGFFEAPVDGQYQFSMAGDDHQYLWLSIPEYTEPLPGEEAVPAPEEYTINPANKRRVMEKLYNSGGFRVFATRSEWVEMRAGQRYYMEGAVVQGNGAHHYTIGVEIAPADPAVSAGASALMTPQEMALRIRQTRPEIRDTAEVTVTGADGGKFKLAYYQDHDGEYFISANITAGGPAHEMRNAVYGYYHDSNVGIHATVVVTLTCRDFDG